MIPTCCNISIENGKEAFLTISLDAFVEVDQLVTGVIAQLDEMIALDKISGGELLRIEGLTSPVVATAVTEKLKNLYDAIALYDADFKGYIVTATCTAAYQIGQVVSV